MPSSSSSSSSGSGPVQTIAGISANACIVAESRWGDNTAANAHEFSVGRDLTVNFSPGQRVWGGAAPLDTGWVSEQLICPVGGGAANPVTWEVAGGNPAPASYGGVTYADFLKVEMCAIATNAPNCTVSLRSIRLIFQSALVGNQTIVVPDILAPEAANNAFSGIRITPGSNGYDYLEITLQYRIVCTQALPNNPLALCGQIWVFANQCAAVNPPPGSGS